MIIAETGGDMGRLRTAAHLASWAGVCPGSHESGGVRTSGTRRNGDKALGAALGRITEQANVLGFTVRFEPIPETAAAT